MADLDFFVDVVVSGAVLGVGLTDSPDTVDQAVVSPQPDEFDLPGSGRPALHIDQQPRRDKARRGHRLHAEDPRPQAG